LENHKGKVTYSKEDKKRIIFGCKCMLYTDSRKRKLLGKALEGRDKRGERGEREKKREREVKEKCLKKERLPNRRGQTGGGDITVLFL
jgi:hypothetical protein